jgi:ankyrin repeat protein
MTTTIFIWTPELIQDLIANITSRDINQPDVLYQETPLHYCVINNDMESARLLIQAGARMDIYDENYFTAFYLAAGYGREEIVRLGIEAGIDVNQRNGSYHWTPLMCAVQSNHVNIVRMLIAAGADVNARSNCLETALICAAKYDYTKLMEILVAAGADINARNSMNRTALMTAVGKNGVKSVKYLIEQGAQTDMNANINVSPRMRALLDHYPRFCSTQTFTRVMAPHPTLYADVLSHIGSFLGYTAAPKQKTPRDMIFTIQGVMSRRY